KYEEAATQFQDIISKNPSGEIQAKAYHNLGNSLLKTQKYKEAIDAYKNALKKSPGDEESKYNLAYAKAKMMQEQQKQNNKDQNNKDKKDKDNKNKQNQENKDKKDEQKNKDKKDTKDKQNQDNQNQDDKKEEKGNQKPDPEKISKEDAQRILDALNNREKDLQKKGAKKEGAKINIEKNW
ncbi:MAG TPA: tetratricopeptide repeat protein, partial [Cytophagaceae bacterium]|nr:tetratricopeptide repeat protein [Cytophagaceae bacterium]